MGRYNFRRDKAVARQIPTNPETIPQSSLVPLPATTHCDWRTSGPHLRLLSLYIEPNNFLDAIRRDWDGALGEPPDVALERLIAEGVLVILAQGEKQIRGLRVADLKRELRARGLFFGGNKEILLQRLTAVDPDYVKAMTEALPLVQCSQVTRAAIVAYLDLEQIKKEAAEASSRALIRARQFSAAMFVVLHYEARQIFPCKVGSDWKRYKLMLDVRPVRFMFSSRPRVLAEFPRDALESLRVAAAMMYLWRESRATKWFQTGFMGVGRIEADRAARMLVAHGEFCRDVDDFKARRVKTVRLMGDLRCEHYRYRDFVRFPLAEVPELPDPECTLPDGCTCDLRAVEWEPS